MNADAGTGGATRGAEPAAMARLISEDAVGQLRRREGSMAALGSEQGVLKLDWVEGVQRLLDDPTALEQVEAEARTIRACGIRHIIWAGMGGSVLAVHVLDALRFGGAPDATAAAQPGREPVTIHPLDSTDPAALNAIVRALAAAKGITPLSAREAVPGKAPPGKAPPGKAPPGKAPPGKAPPATTPAGAAASGAAPETTASAGYLRALLGDVMMIGVAMGMTSEEPITHLTWFADLVARAGLAAAEHLLVMTLPGSYLDAFAREHQVPSRPLQLDGGSGTGGRMSAPTTRVFLLPAALALTGRSNASGELRALLRRAWNEFDLALAAARPADHPYVRLAAALSTASAAGTCRLLLHLPEGWRSLVPWIEQLMEESLGKGGKGVVVFHDQALNQAAPGYRAEGMLRVRVVTAPATAERDHAFLLVQPTLARAEPRERLAALAASFLGWQLTMALYGYLHRIPFAGQPAVENYKARARALRERDDPLRIVATWRPSVHEGALTLLMPPGATAEVPDAAASGAPAAAFARALRDAVSTRDPLAPAGAPRSVDRPSLEYLDVTGNGVAPADLLTLLDEHALAIGNDLLGVPVKLRRAPAAYHSTEQSEMDGPPDLVSLRLVARATEPNLLGSYSSAFLHAQAVSTWQAMVEVGRLCYLLVIDGTLEDAREPLAGFLADVERDLARR